MKTRFILPSFCASVLVGLTGCGAAPSEQDDPGGTDVSSEARVLAEVDIPQGKARLVALDSDMIFIQTVLPIGTKSPLSDPAIRGAKLADVYEHLTGDTAPDEVRAKPFVLEQPEAKVTDGIGEVTSALSDGEFKDQICPGQQWCWAQAVSGTWEHEERAMFWRGQVESLNGVISIQMRRRNAFGVYSQVWKTDVLEGELTDMLGATSDTLSTKRWLKFKIFNSDPNVEFWHAAATWQ